MQTIIKSLPRARLLVSLSVLFIRILYFEFIIVINLCNFVIIVYLYVIRIILYIG